MFGQKHGIRAHGVLVAASLHARLVTRRWSSARQGTGDRGMHHVQLCYSVLRSVMPLAPFASCSAHSDVLQGLVREDRCALELDHREGMSWLHGPIAYNAHNLSQ